MLLLGLFRKIDRNHWFVCNLCMMQTGHDTLNSVFYSEEDPVLILDRPWMQCPRCGSTNTRSFRDIEKNGSESALWGLERIVKKYPRRRFEVQSTASKSAS